MLLLNRFTASPKLSVSCLLVGLLGSIIALVAGARNNELFLVFLGATALLLTSLLGGILLCLTLIARHLRVARVQLSSLRHLSSASVVQKPASEQRELESTGLQMLDALLTDVRRSSANLLEIIASLGSEMQAIIERYEILINNLAASVLLYDLNGKISYASPYTEVLTGYRVEELTEAKDDFIADIVVEEDRARYQRAKQVSALGEDINVRYQIRHHSGLNLWVETHLVPIANEDGEIVSVMGVTIDMTALVRHQLLIEEQNKDVKDFSYMISHDLKAPVFTIKGMASLLKEDYGPSMSKEGLESLGYIIEGANRLEQLIASVIEYSSISIKELEVSDVSLSEVLSSARKDLTQQIRDSQAQISIEENLPLVQGDRLRLYQVFSNLLANAIKYRSPERQLQVYVRLQEHSAQQVVIEICDNGLGIPESKLEDIFRPYHRAHGREIEGSGIGLACVRKILDRLGGSIKATSQLGKGSVFTVILKAPQPKTRVISEDLARIFQ